MNAVASMALCWGLLVPGPAWAGHALDFDGSDDRVSMGTAGLGLAEFTLECWFRWDGAGVPVYTGYDGVYAYPLVSKGSYGGDGDTDDFNYILGIDSTLLVLVADFEDLGTGANHPVRGTTDVSDGVWHHAAAAFDGAGWTLVLDGIVQAEASTSATPRYDSSANFVVGSTIDPDGMNWGYFRGAIDSVRLWDHARNLDQIWDTVNEPVDLADGLAAGWSFDEGSGSTATDAVGGANGSIFGAAWTGDAPHDLNRPPGAPQIVWPGDGETGVSVPVTLQVEVDDREGDTLQVQFYGRQTPQSQDAFSIVALPDTQYYSADNGHGSPEIFEAQTEWIVSQREEMDIRFVTHLGDIVDDGDDETQWLNAEPALTLLEDPATTGLTDGIPYGLTLGNHDQEATTVDEPNPLFNQYFGVERFEGRGYYGGHYGVDNDNSYQLFSGGGLGFVAVHLEYDTSPDADVLQWAHDVIAADPDRLAMVTTHYMINTAGVFSTQGQAIYDALEDLDNLFLLLGGHIHGESRRSDRLGPHPVYTMLSDYQSRDNGGDGWLRTLIFVPDDDVIQVHTFSPTREESEFDSDSEFALSYPLSRPRFQPLGDPVTVDAPGVASLSWSGLESDTCYQWYVEVADERSTRGNRWDFCAGDGTGDDDDTADDDDTTTGDDDDSATDDDTDIGDTLLPRNISPGCACTVDQGSGDPDPGGALVVMLASLAVFKRRRASLG